jgi:predicted DsbA family dithiol-disulfide isomerase
VTTQCCCVQPRKPGSTSQARAVLSGNEFADAVRAELQHWRSLGIQVVPTIIVDERLLIQGGYPPEAFEQMLREIAAGLTPA